MFPNIGIRFQPDSISQSLISHESSFRDSIKYSIPHQQILRKLLSYTAQREYAGRILTCFDNLLTKVDLRNRSAIKKYRAIITRFQLCVYEILAMSLVFDSRRNLQSLLRNIDCNFGFFFFFCGTNRFEYFNPNLPFQADGKITIKWFRKTRLMLFTKHFHGIPGPFQAGKRSAGESFFFYIALVRSHKSLIPRYIKTLLLYYDSLVL